MKAPNAMLTSRLLIFENWQQNVLAGLVVGLVALPLSMAFAIASGATPAQGLVTAIVAALFVALFGGSRVQVAGPTGAFVVVLAAITAKHGYIGLQVATLMAGAMLVVIGALRLGALVRFVPEPVILGFTSGIATVIWVGQWKDFFGLESVKGDSFIIKLRELLIQLPHLDVPTVGLAVSTLILILAIPKIPIVNKLPGPIVGLFFATGFVALSHLSSIATIGNTFGELPKSFPPLQLPMVPFEKLHELIQPAITIALLGALESLLSATVADSMLGTRHKPSKELIGQGLANIATSLTGGFAATGAIARTATSIRYGGTTPLASITHAFVLVAILLFGAAVTGRIPLCALAAILFLVAYRMFDFKRVGAFMRTAPRGDIAIFVTTCLFTVVTDLVVAVGVGLILAILRTFYRTTLSVDMRTLSPADLQTERNLVAPSGTHVVQISGPLFFAVAHRFEAVASGMGPADVNHVVVNFSQVTFIDETGLNALREILHKYHKQSVQVSFTEANPLVYEKLRHSGLLNEFGIERYHRFLHEAVHANLLKPADQLAPVPAG